MPKRKKREPMRVNRSKKARESAKKREDLGVQVPDKIIKFNLSYDNLKCFMNEKGPKTDRKHISTRYDFSMTDSKKYRQPQEDKQGLDLERRTLVRGKSPEPFLSASNEILVQIEKNGLKCVWSEIEQSKTEVSEEEWQENELLHQTFSECSSSYGKNISHASTIDRYSTYYGRPYSQSGMIVGYTNEQYIDQAALATSEYMMATKARYYECQVFDINPINIGQDPRTTLMIKNIPNKYTIQDLSNQIDQNFQNSYDFLYLPCDIKNNCNVGYGFINFVSTDILFEFYKRFHNKKWLKFRSDKICVLTYARLQGLSSLIEHFQNSKVLNHKDKRYQPIIKNIRECKKIETLIKQQKSEQSSANV